MLPADSYNLQIRLHDVQPALLRFSRRSSKASCAEGVASIGSKQSSSVCTRAYSRQVCTGADTEMITQGGELAFVSRMIQESKAASNIRYALSLLST
jgi:23S rRNA A1618 N6-methylase RlmF